MRGTLPIMLSTLAILSLAACEYNGSPLHSELNYEEFRGRVRQHFHAGMSADEVERALLGLELKPEWNNARSWNCFDPEARGFHPYIQPPGFFEIRSLGATPKGPRLHLVIDETDRLKCVTYDGSGDWSGGLIVQ